jgi:Mg-chelatase subunit ChlD
MKAIAEYECTKTGKMINDGMSMLDIVKHAVKAVMFTLGPEDRLSVVTFAGNAFVNIPLTNMQNVSRDLAVTKLENMPTRGVTDLWSGLHTAMECLRAGKKG